MEDPIFQRDSFDALVSRGRTVIKTMEEIEVAAN